MASSLRIEVLLSAIDRATKPFRNITKGASGAAEAVRKSKQALAALEKTSGDITGYARLRAALRGNAATLGEHTAKAAANRAELETQRAAHHALAGEVKASRAAFQQHAAQFAALKKPSAAATANYQAQKTALAALEARYSTSAAALRKKRDGLIAAEGGVRRFTQRNTELTSKLEAVRGRLEASGYSTDKLASRQRQLRAEMQRANQAITQQIQRADALARSQARLQAASGKMTRGGMLASAHGAGFYAAGSVASDRLGQTLQPGVDLQAQMRDISITGGFNKGQEAALTAQIRRDAVLYAQTTDTISRGLSVLVANGISDAKALGNYSGMLAKKSVASGAEVEDLSNTIVSLTQNLDIAAKDVSGAIDSLAYSGKQGSFELRDMAKWMPQLSPMMAALGVKGRGAVDELGAALQVARLGAGTSDEAANNLRNYLAKIISPDTLQNFDKAGIDLKQRLLELQAKGVSPLQGSLRVITEYMGKKGPEATRKLQEALKLKDNEQRQQALDQLAEAYALGDLFRDQQAMSFIRPALMNDGKMQSIRQGAAGADGVLDQDFDKRMETAQKRMDLLRIKLTELKLKGFDLMAPSIAEWSERLGNAVDRVTRFATANPALAAFLFKSAAALAAIAIAAGVVLIPLGLMASTVGHLISVIATLQRLNAGAGLARLGGVFRTAAGGARMLLPVLGGISAPVLLIGAAVATVALLVWKHWGPIEAFLGGMGEGLRGVLLPVWEQLQGAMAPLQPVIDGVGRVLAVVWGTLKEMVRPFQATNAQLQAANGYGRTLGAVLGAVIGVPLRMIVGLLGMFARVLRFAFEWSPVGMVVRNWGSILPRIQAFVAGIGMYLRGAWSVVTGIFSGDGGKIRAGLQTMWAGINTVLAGWPARMLQLGQNVVQGLINGIRAKATAVGTAMGNVAGSAVAKVKQSLGIRSPSRVFAELGGFTMQGFADGLQAGARGPLGALDAMGERMRKAGAGIALGALSGPAMAAVGALPPQALDVLPQLQALDALPAMRLDVLPQLRALQPGAGGADQDAADDAPAFPPVDPRPPLAAAAPGRAAGSGGNTYHINITAPPGGNAQDIARLVRDEIERLEHHRRVRYRAEMSDYE